MLISFYRYAALALSVLLAACATNESLKIASAPDMPAAYEASIEFPHQNSVVPSVWWWESYGSRELNSLVARALVDNPELRIAESQVAQAKIRALQADSARLPVVSLPVRATAGAGGGGETLQNSQLGLQATYRLDIWGELSAQAQSADLMVLRATFDKENVKRNLSAAVISTYVSYLHICDSVAIARQNETVTKEILDSIERRFAVGDATTEELELQRSSLYAAQSAIHGLESQRYDIKLTLTRLLGALPRDIDLRGDTIDELLIPAVKTELPSSLLLSRPDIRAVEARMRAANANISVARARLLPSFDLAAQGGYNGLGLADFVQPQNLFLSGIASIAMTIFDGGRRDAEVALAMSAYQEMVITYGQTVYQAIREVESALSGLRSANLKFDTQKMITRSALSLLGSSVEGFKMGATDTTSLLQTRKAYLRSLEDLKRTKADALNAYVRLSQALGTQGEESIQ